MEELSIFTDGGSRGNPGESAIGVVIKNSRGDTLKEYNQCIGIKTNNEAEYEAIIFALKKAKAFVGKKKLKSSKLSFYMDSELAVNQLNGIYKLDNSTIQKNFIEIWNLKILFGNVNFTHVPREKNKRADMLVNKALDECAKSPNLF